MKFVVLLYSIFYKTVFTQSCQCDYERFLQTKLDKLDREIADAIREDLHFDGEHPSFSGPADFLSNRFSYQKRGWQERMGGEWLDKKDQDAILPISEQNDRSRDLVEGSLSWDDVPLPWSLKLENKRNWVNDRRWNRDFVQKRNWVYKRSDVGTMCAQVLGINSKRIKYLNEKNSH